MPPLPQTVRHPPKWRNQSPRICKNVDLTGSRIGKRKCKTKEEWEQSESVMELGQKGAQGSISR
jgi:hypothetical protein